MKYVTTNYVVLLLLLPSIVKTFSEMFNWVDIEGKYRLAIDTTVQVGGNQTFLINFLMAILGSLIWGAGIPLYSVYQISEIDRLEETNKLEFGLLYNGYKYTNYWWEAVINLRKVFMILAVTIFSTKGKLYQTIVLLFILSFALALQVAKEPFKDPKFNNIETFSLVTALVLVYGGYYLTSSTDDKSSEGRNDFNVGKAFEIAFFGIFLIIFVYSMCLWLKKFSYESNLNHCKCKISF